MSKKASHILILSSWYPTKAQPFLGNFVQRLADLLGERYRITVVVTEAEKDLKYAVIESSEKGNYYEIRIKHPSGKHPVQKLLQQRKALKLAFTKIDDVDLIIGNILLPKGMHFVQAKKHFKCPLIYLEHGSYFRKEMRSTWSISDKLILHNVRKHVDHVVAVSPIMASDLHNDFATEQIETIGNHVDTSLFSFIPKVRQEKVSFLHVSTLDPRTKNPQGIFDACKLLKEKTDQFVLTVVCDEDDSLWRKWCKENDLNDVVEFVGAQSWMDLPSFYQKADAFVLFSNYESFSIVLVEAWATGTPTLSTPVGIASTMDDKLGILVERNNPRHLADSMCEIIANKSTFDGETISSLGQQYSKANIAVKWDELIAKYVNVAI